MKILALLTVLICCLPSVVWAKNKLLLTGSSTVAPLTLEIAKRYEQLHPEFRIDVQMGGSSRGIRDARTGLADIGMVSRAMTAEESDLQSLLIAIDGVGLVVHQSNPIKNLSRAQVIDIYTGQTDNWQALGGPDLPITVVHKAAGRSTAEVFLGHFGLKHRQIKAQVVIGDNQQGIKTVTANPGAIAYISIGTAEYEVEQGSPIRLLDLAGVKAGADTVKNGTYALTRELNWVVKGPVSEAAQSFIDYARSPGVQDLIEAQFFVVP